MRSKEKPSILLPSIRRKVEGQKSGMNVVLNREKVDIDSKDKRNNERSIKENSRSQKATQR